MAEQPQESSWQRYARKSIRAMYRPKNEWEHGEGMLNSSYAKEDELLSASQIVDKYVQLCNVDSDVLMRLIQKDANNLTHFEDMSEREPLLVPFYRLMIHSWRNELLATKMFKGKERGHQAAIGIKKQEQQPYGFGQGYAEEMQPEKPQNFLQRMFSRKPQE